MKTENAIKSIEYIDDQKKEVDMYDHVVVRTKDRGEGREEWKGRGGDLGARSTGQTPNMFTAPPSGARLS